MSKERFTFDTTNLIFNDNTKGEFLDDIEVCELLNQQQQRIAELEEENKNLHNDLIDRCLNSISNDDYDEVVSKLEKQLKELPKQIVEKIKEYISNSDDCEIIDKYTHNKIIEFLDNLLKEYQGDGE